MLQGQKHCLLIFHISLYKLFRYMLLPVFVTSYAFSYENQGTLLEANLWACLVPISRVT
jgi:hypothetical protein